MAIIDLTPDGSTAVQAIINENQKFHEYQPNTPGFRNTVPAINYPCNY